MFLAPLLLLLLLSSSTNAAKQPVSKYESKMVSNNSWVSLGIFPGVRSFHACSSKCHLCSGCGAFIYDSASSSCDLGGELDLPGDEVSSGGMSVFACNMKHTRLWIVLYRNTVQHHNKNSWLLLYSSKNSSFVQMLKNHPIVIYAAQIVVQVTAALLPLPGATRPSAMGALTSWSPQRGQERPQRPNVRQQEGAWQCSSRKSSGRT